MDAPYFLAYWGDTHYIYYIDHPDRDQEMTNSVANYDKVTKTATSDKGLCNRDRVRFHYFNPNGAVQKKYAMDNCLATFVDAGVINSGWHIAHGTFNDYHVKAIVAELDKRRVRSFNINYPVERILQEIDETYSKLGEVILNIRGKNGRRIEDNA